MKELAMMWPWFKPVFLYFILPIIGYGLFEDEVLPRIKRR